MQIPLDTYSWRARALPAYLTIVPVAFALAAVMPKSLNLSVGGVVALLFIPLSYFAGQVGADFGKQRERQLWNQWGGPPTTRFLRHSDQEYNSVTRQRIHGKLRELDLHVPTREEETQNPHSADEHYGACTQDLIRRTRDMSRFPLVFKGLTEYGFRRNLLGLKPLALPITSVALLVCGWEVVRTWQLIDPPSVAILATVLTSILLVSWVVWVREKYVRLTADRYARFLLEAALDQE